MTFGSLFAGIGGMDLGLERAGMTCSWQVEIDPFARRVLAKHWPDVRRHDDVRTFPPGDADRWGVDLICGGFPCQDISIAGPRVGLDGPRSGLWFEFARVIRMLRPCFVVVENVPALLVRGMGRILGDLSELGYDAEWSTLAACSMGAPHTRERLFLVAYSGSFDGHLGIRIATDRKAQDESCDDGTLSCHWSIPFAGILGMAHRNPGWVDRSRTLGNAVVPQIAEYVGRLIFAGQEAP